MFLRISPDEYVNTEEIVHIRAVDEMSCSLTTEAGVFLAQYPMDTLVSILRNEEAKEGQDEAAELKVLQQMNHKIGELPVFAG